MSWSYLTASPSTHFSKVGSPKIKPISKVPKINQRLMFMKIIHRECNLNNLHNTGLQIRTTITTAQIRIQILIHMFLMSRSFASLSINMQDKKECTYMHQRASCIWSAADYKYTVFFSQSSFGCNTKRMFRHAQWQTLLVCTVIYFTINI